MITRLKVGELIDQKVRATRHCHGCSDFADVDLEAAAAAKGADFS